MSEFYGVFHPEMKLPIGDLHESKDAALQAIENLKDSVKEIGEIPFTGLRTAMLLLLLDKLTVKLVRVESGPPAMSPQEVITHLKGLKGAANLDANRRAYTPEARAFAEGQQSGINFAIDLLRKMVDDA